MSRSKTAKLWQQRMRRFASSQMTVAQFCLSEGVSQPSFYQWKKKLRELPNDAKPKPSAAGVQFLPLQLTALSGKQVASEFDQRVGSAVASTTIELPGGVRIRVEVPTDRQPRHRWETQA